MCKNIEAKRKKTFKQCIDLLIFLNVRNLLKHFSNVQHVNNISLTLSKIFILQAFLRAEKIMSYPKIVLLIQYIFEHWYNLLNKCVVSGASDGRHLSGDGAADAKAAGGDAAGHERVRQPAAAHHRHLHQRRHIGTFTLHYIKLFSRRIKMRTIQATNKRATIWNCYDKSRLA